MKTTLLTSWMHLRDEVLAAAALHLQNGDSSVLSPTADAHLAQCPRCVTRLEDLRVVLANQRTALNDAVDARFSQDVLDAQRHGILARLAERHAGARVLRFPTAVVHLPQPQHPWMRTIAGAMAAGFFVAALTGQALYTTNVLIKRASLNQPPVRHVSNALQRAPYWKVESGPDAPAADERDENVLGEIENSLVRGVRRNPALRALDEMTPRVPGAEPRRHQER